VERPVEPKPPRGVLGVLGRVVGVVPGRIAGVVDGRAVVGVAVRVNAGRDQWLELLVRVQLEPELPQDRRGEHPSAAAAPGTAGPVAAGGLPVGGQVGGVIA
jgi:hypothetical protein